MIGTTLSHYRITDKLGAGGMGEVYRAEDTNLDRQVAIKVLPDIFSGDPERLARFEREAKLLASLNHPNIAAIYALEQAGGKRLLVLELVEGETLAQRIAKGPLPVDEALDVCRQIAEGLEAAHEKGIIHRDLKPANVKITPEGKVKVLDFGLAKAFQGETAAADASHSPTLTDQMTHPGVILGTAAYMSPEQAKGKVVDKRTDIWAFGCVLYECLTGKRAFGGETVTETMAAILMRDPAWDALQPTISLRLKDLLCRCLQKDARRRLRDIGDAAMEIEAASQEPASRVAATSRFASSWRLAAGIAIGILAVVAIGVWFFWYLWFPSPEANWPVSRFRIPLDGEKRTNVRIQAPSLVISDDGKRIAWIGGKGETTQIFTRELNGLEIKPIPGTENVSFTLCFSPNGQWVCFPRKNVLYKIPISGGAPQKIYTAENPNAVLFGLDWTEAGIILASSYSGLQLISENGTSKQSLIKIDREGLEILHGGPRMLPGNEVLLFYACIGSMDAFHLYALDLSTLNRKIIMENVELAQYLPATGHLLFARAGSLYSAPFDPRKLTAGGETSLQIPIQMEMFSRDGFWDVSSNGILAYVDHDPAINSTRLEWVDKAGKREPLNLPPGIYFSPMLDPDGKSFAYGYSHTGVLGSQIWKFDLSRRVPEQLTRIGTSSENPVWRRNPRQLVFDSNPPNLFWNLHIQNLDTKVEPKRLHESNSYEFPHSFSPDGKYLLFTERSLDGQFDLRILDMLNPQASPIPVAASTSARESYGRFRPKDGLWIAYTSDEDDGRYEIFVKEFIPGSPESGTKKRVSFDGGVEPVWSPEGDKIFYRNVDGTKLYSVSFYLQPTPSLGAPKEVLSGLSLPPFEILSCIASYDISADGKKFIMVVEPENAGLATNIVIVQNWFQELKQKVPTGK